MSRHKGPGERTSGLRMKLLLLLMFPLVALGSTATDQLTRRCDLRGKVLKVAKERGATVDEHVVARIVCHAEMTTGFNSSVVTSPSQRTDDGPARARRELQHAGPFRLANRHLYLSTAQPHTRGRRHASEQLGHQDQDLNQDQEDGWTLYGLFQLSNRFCHDGVAPSLDVCEVDCKDLTDVEEEDDIVCVLNILQVLLKQGFAAPPEVKTMIRLIFRGECQEEKPSEYFAGCLSTASR